VAVGQWDLLWRLKRHTVSPVLFQKPFQHAKTKGDSANLPVFPWMVASTPNNVANLIEVVESKNFV